MELQSCENCEYAVPAGGSKVATLICRHKPDTDLPWQVVEPSASCSNFQRARELVSIDVASALTEGAKLIPLTRDKFAIVDAEDYDRLNKYKWHALKGQRNYYARNHRPNGTVLMHRVILNAPRGLVVDHINHNGLDNRKRNLRLCTAAQNSQNRRPRTRPNKTSKYKGVTFDKNRNRFAAYIKHNKKAYFLGRFKDETDAAKAYDKKAKELFGQFAYLNFPENYDFKQNSIPF